MQETPALRRRIKELIIESLNLEDVKPEEIGDGDLLFSPEGLQLDSVDALELVVVLEQEFGIRIDGQQAGAESFATVTSLAGMVERLLGDGT